MSLLSRLFGMGSGVKTPPAPEPEAYKGYAIFAEPVREGSQWRVAARIEKELDGEARSHSLIRADMLGDPDAAAAESVTKAKRLIDEQGDAIFDRTR